MTPPSSRNGDAGNDRSAADRAGPIRAMARNRVAANLLLILFLVGGAASLSRVNREVFPKAQLDIVTVNVPYPGATPAEVVEGIILPVEEAVRGVDNIKEIRSTAYEGAGLVVAELVTGADPNQALNDIEAAVNRITAFPESAETPVISLPSTQDQVLSLLIHGDVERQVLDRISTQARADLLGDSRVSRVTVTGIPEPEISIEISQENLRRYGLSLPEIGARVAAATVETGVGRIESEGGNVALRVLARREVADAFRNLEVITTPEGVRLPLDAIAEIRETFRDDDRAAFFNGQPAVNLGVFRGADQDPQATARAVEEYLERQKPLWGPEVDTMIWADYSRIYQDRVSLLLKNGCWGLVFVLLILGLFLRPRLAFWVTLGIPVSILGVFIILPMLGVSINMISLFAFILVLGIVVDDAIVVGEAAFHQRRHHRHPMDAAIAGAREVNVPVVFAVTTTILAFAPMLFIPGVMGKFFRVIPLCVIPILLISLLESLFVLPAHVGHARADRDRRNKDTWWRKASRLQERFSAWVEQQIDTRYRRVIEAAVAWRFLVLAVATALLVISVAVFASGRLRFVFFPDIEADQIVVQLEMAEGTTADVTQTAMEQIVSAGDEAVRELAGDQRIQRGTLALLAQQFSLDSGPEQAAGVSGASHFATIIMTLVPGEEREIAAQQIVEAWRRAVGEIPGAQRLEISSSLGPSSGADLAFQLSHEDEATLERAAQRLADRLNRIENVHDVDPGYRRGNTELRLRLKPAARALGISEQELASQVRAAFFGFEAVRQQRGRDELRVYVRLPEDDRERLDTIDRMVVFTPGGEIPLAQAASITWDRAYTSIERVNGRRAITVTGDVTSGSGLANPINAMVLNQVLPEFRRDIPGLSWEISGEREEQQETLSALSHGFVLAFIVIYGLLATIFRSYVQPLLVILAVPFGVIGAVVGHLMLGYEISLMSVLGIVALAGVVVNDSLVLIDVINRQRREGADPDRAIIEGGIRRFRAVILTSLTTFAGLAPMISETSLQARFLIPMAISLGFGVVLVTPITLILVPALYRILVDLKRVFTRDRSEAKAPGPDEQPQHAAR